MALNIYISLFERVCGTDELIFISVPYTIILSIEISIKITKTINSIMLISIVQLYLETWENSATIIFN